MSDETEAHTTSLVRDADETEEAFQERCRSLVNFLQTTPLFADVGPILEVPDPTKFFKIQFRLKREL